MVKEGFVLYRPTDGTGWGNKLRGLVLCHILSQATGRRLYVDDPLIDEFFWSPFEYDWVWKHVKKKGEDSLTTRIRARLSPDNWDDVAWQAYKSDDLEVLFPGQNWELNDGLSFADALLENPRYSDVWVRNCWLATNKIEWMGRAVSFLLARPKEKLLRRVKGSPPAAAGIQFRTFYDIGSPSAGFVDPFLIAVEANLDARSEASRPHSFYITTDNLAVSERIQDLLRLRGSVIVANMRRMVHTGVNETPLFRLMNRFLRKLRITDRDIDFWSWVPEVWRNRPEATVLADWYSLGECQEIFSTFTSFAVFAAARTGNRAKLWRYDVNTGILSEMTNEDYVF